ncbi:MAG TPA: HigA family addiction module antitoxin [Acidocella sp.]|jgi:addiction module HigA family antidote|nr:HigA family addiction module antitoxin [Acidocella sp.]
MSISREDASRMSFDDMIEPGSGVLDPVTPGEILRAEFMEPLGLSARALAREIGVPPNRITAILHGERGITAETAIRLARRFNSSARFWMNLQVAYDLAIAERNIGHAA